MAAKNNGSVGSKSAKRKGKQAKGNRETHAGRRSDPEGVVVASRPEMEPGEDEGAMLPAAADRAERGGRASGGNGSQSKSGAKQTPSADAGSFGRRSGGGDGGAGGLLARVAAVGSEYGTALTETGRDGLARAGTLVRRGTSAVGEYGAALGEYGRDGLTKAGTAVRRGATVVGQAAADGLDLSRQATARGWDAYPLAFCGAALAAGVVVGLLLPSTQVEDNVMGKAADRVNGRIKKTAGGLAARGKGLADKALTEVKAATTRAVEQEGLTPDEIGRKVKRLAGTVREAVVGAADPA